MGVSELGGTEEEGGSLLYSMSSKDASVEGVWSLDAIRDKSGGRLGVARVH